MLILHLEFESHGSLLFKRATSQDLDVRNTAKLLTTAIKREKRGWKSYSPASYTPLWWWNKTAFFSHFSQFCGILMMFSRCSAETSFPRKFLYLLQKASKSLCVCATGLQVFATWSVNTHWWSHRLLFYPPYKNTQEMDCSGSLGQFGDPGHKLLVESHLVLSVKFSSAKVYVIIALFAPFSPSLFPEL